jgi:hypothetical protein
VRDWVGVEGVARFHDVRGDTGGICHQVLPENGYVLPGQIVVGSDSHTTSHGALGAFAFGIGATEMASVWALGRVQRRHGAPAGQVLGGVAGQLDRQLGTAYPPPNATFREMPTDDAWQERRGATPVKRSRRGPCRAEAMRES